MFFWRHPGAWVRTEEGTSLNPWRTGWDVLEPGWGWGWKDGSFGESPWLCLLLLPLGEVAGADEALWPAGPVRTGCPALASQLQEPPHPPPSRAGPWTVLRACPPPPLFTKRPRVTQGSPGHSLWEKLPDPSGTAEEAGGRAPLGDHT